MVYDLFPIAILWVRFSFSFFLFSSFAKSAIHFSLATCILPLTLPFVLIHLLSRSITGVITLLYFLNPFLPLPSYLLSLDLTSFSTSFFSVSLVETPQSTCIFLIFEYLFGVLMHSGYGDRFWVSTFFFSRCSLASCLRFVLRLFSFFLGF